MSEITILPSPPITLQMTEGNSRPIIIDGGDPIVIQVADSLVLTGAITYPAPQVLNDLTDVTIASPTSQQMLVYQTLTNQWENQGNVPSHTGRHYLAGGDQVYIDASQIVTGTISSTYLGSHKTTHQDGGTDELALDGSQITTGSVVAARLGVHATTHQDGGTDELALDGSQITTGTVLAARLAAHKTSHQDGGSDELALDASQITTGNFAAVRLGAHAYTHQDGGTDELALDASQITTGLIPAARLGGHASTHTDGGTDEISIDASQMTTGTIAVGRLSALPTHASTHNDGGADELALDASQITTGTIALARLPAPTIDYVNTVNTTDVVMTTANQVYTVASISLPAGTWMINGQTVLTQGASAGGAAMTMFIYNTTTPAYLASTSAHKTSVTSTSQGLNCSAVVVLSVTSTIQMKAVSSIAAYTARYLSTTGNYDGATSLYAVRIAP